MAALIQTIAVVDKSGKAVSTVGPHPATSISTADAQAIEQTSGQRFQRG